MKKLAEEYIAEATYDITKIFNKLDDLPEQEREKELKSMIVWLNKEGHFSLLKP